MNDTYSIKINTDGSKSFISSNILYPEIRIANGIASANVNLTALISAVNFRLSRTAVYNQAAGKIAKEGVILDRMVLSGSALSGTIVPRNNMAAAGKALFPQNPDGTFKNDPNKGFELKGLLNLDQFKNKDGGLNYDSMAETFLEETILHPGLGVHNWKRYPASKEAVLADRVAGTAIRANSETGYSARLKTEGSSYLKAVSIRAFLI
jgi:hypothetical protein